MKLRRLPGKKKHFEVIFHERAEYHLLWELLIFLWFWRNLKGWVNNQIGLNLKYIFNKR